MPQNLTSLISQANGISAILPVRKKRAQSINSNLTLFKTFLLAKIYIHKKTVTLDKPRIKIFTFTVICLLPNFPLILFLSHLSARVMCKKNSFSTKSHNKKRRSGCRSYLKKNKMIVYVLLYFCGLFSS